MTGLESNSYQGYLIKSLSQWPSPKCLSSDWENLDISWICQMKIENQFVFTSWQRRRDHGAWPSHSNISLCDNESLSPWSTYSVRPGSFWLDCWHCVGCNITLPHMIHVQTHFVTQPVPSEQEYLMISVRSCDIAPSSLLSEQISLCLLFENSNTEMTILRYYAAQWAGGRRGVINSKVQSYIVREDRSAIPAWSPELAEDWL